MKVKGSGDITSYVKITPSDGKGRNNSTFNLVINGGLLDYENENGMRDVSFQVTSHTIDIFVSKLTFQ